MGSRILSRSFHVEKWQPEDHEADIETEDQDPDFNAQAMDVDHNSTLDGEAEQDPSETIEAAEEDEDDEDADAEDPSDVAMVPMADMLNARFESENVGRIQIERIA